MTSHSPLIRDLLRLQKQEIVASWKPRKSKVERERHKERAETYRKALNYILKEMRESCVKQ